jgi:hypothetical protein
MDMKIHNFEIWNKPLGTIWEHKKKRVEGWELATFIIVIIQPLLMQKSKDLLEPLIMKVHTSLQSE